jgi:hypothetical protein
VSADSTPTAEVVEQFLRDRDARADERARRYPGEWIARDRVLPLVFAWFERRERQALGGMYRFATEAERMSVGAREALADGAGVNVRTIWRLTTEKPSISFRKGGRQVVTAEGAEKYLSFDYVDRLLIAMNAEYLWHVDAADGGFADVYEAAPLDAAEVALLDRARRAANRRNACPGCDGLKSRESILCRDCRSGVQRVEAVAMRAAA